MAYSEKVIQHYNEPKNVGSLDRKKSNVGSGLVGAPECGDVMKLDIQVAEDGKIEDAKFKTFGCVGSETHVMTSYGWRFIRSLEVEERVLAYDGEVVIENKIEGINEIRCHMSDMLIIEVKGATNNIICSKDHIFWGESNRPREAITLSEGDLLMSFVDDRPEYSIRLAEILSISEITDFSQTEYVVDNFAASGAHREGEYYSLYDLRLSNGANVYITNGIFSHNCGSAIASSSLATEWIKGKTVDEAMQIQNTMIVEELSLPPVKIHCSVLAEDAIKAAITDYRKKQAAVIVEEAELIEEISESVAEDLDIYQQSNVEVKENLESKY